MFESEELVCLGKGTGLWSILAVVVTALLVSVLYLVAIAMVGVAAVVVEVVACSKNASHC